MSDDEGRPGPGGGDGLLTQLIAAGAASVVLGVLFYMGRVTTYEWYRYFHLDPQDLQLSVGDYALRSIALLSPDMIMALAAAVTLAAVLRYLAGAIPEESSARWARALWFLRRHTSSVALWLGVALCACGVAAGLTVGRSQVPTIVILLLLGTGTLLAAWSQRGTAAGRVAFAMAVVVAALCGLWAAALHSRGLGTRDAEDFARRLGERPQVVVLSANRLAIATPSVREEELKEAGGRFRFRYSGLRLLAARGERFYVLPDGWNRSLDPTFVLRDSDDLRVELYTSGR